MKRKNLICIGSDEGGAFRGEGGTFARFSTGLLVNLLARDYEKVVWCAPCERAKKENCAVRLAENVEFIESPDYRPDLSQTFARRDHFRESWKKALAEPGDVFILGQFPAVADLYDLCATSKNKTLHWLFDNPFARINASGGGFLSKKLALFSASQWENAVKRGAAKTNGAFLCAGREICERMDGFERYDVVAAPILESDFLWRDDVCQGETIRVLFAGRVCPVNGVASLVEALTLLQTDRRVEFVCVDDGESNDVKYNELLQRIVRDNRLEDRVSFLGRADRERVLGVMRQSDVFVFPALAADAPYEIAEARAQGLPTIACAVGGLPSSIEDGTDGLLVPPGDPSMIADAIDCVVADDELRRQLIAEGYASAQGTTFDGFAQDIVKIFDEMNGRAPDAEEAPAEVVDAL